MNLKHLNHIRTDFEKRFTYAQSEFVRHKTQEYSNPLVEKMMELHELDLTTFSGFFHRIMGWNGINCIEGLEAFNSFVGNFLDDSYCRIVYDDRQIKFLNEVNQCTSEALGEEFKPINPPQCLDVWVIEWCSDREEYICFETLMVTLNRLIDRAHEKIRTSKEVNEWMKELED